MLFSPLSKIDPGAKVNLAHPVAVGFKGCWLINELGGNKIRNSAPGINPGTLQNHAQLVGGAVLLDGVDDYIALSNNMGFMGNAALGMPLSWSIWFYLNSSAATQCLFGFGYSTRYYELRAETDLTASMTICDASEIVMKSSNTWNLNAWNHVVGTCLTTSGPRTIYLNGVRTALAMTFCNTYSWNSFNIGAGIITGTPNYTSGYLALPMVWRRYLSQQDVATLYGNPYAMFERRPVWMGWSGGGGETRSLIAAITGASSTPGIFAILTRALAAGIATGSVTPDISATAARFLLAQIATSSSASDVQAILVRSLMAAITPGSFTPDAVASVTRNILANIAVLSATPDIAATIENAIYLSAAIAGVSITPDIAAGIARSLSALISGQSITPDIVAKTIRGLLANIQGTSITPDDLILILAGLGVILDPTIESITPRRIFESVTPERSFTSITPRRTIHNT